MTPDARLFKFVHCLAAGCIFFVSSANIASARNWRVDFEQEQIMTATLQALPDESVAKSCPEQFRPVRLTTNFSVGQHGAFLIKAASSDLNQPTEQETEKVNESIQFDLKVELTGCAFRNYFRPQAGQAVLSGAVGNARLDRLRYDLVGSESNRTGYYGAVGTFLEYAAHLSGPLEVRVSRQKSESVHLKLPSTVSPDQVMGILEVKLPEDWLTLTADTGKQEKMEISWNSVKLVVLPVEASDR